MPGVDFLCGIKSWRQRKFRHLAIERPYNHGTNFSLRHSRQTFIHRLPRKQNIQRAENVSIETSNLSQPGMAERAIDTATDVSRTITEVTTTLQAAVDRLSDAIATARQPGKPLSTISAITREAPLASLFVAFLFGVALTRRR